MDPIETIKLLYIEDDEVHAMLVTEMLKKCKRRKFDIIHKKDLQSGVDYLKSIDCNIDAVLLDLVLPNSSGVATFQAVYDACVSVPIIIISGFENIACECISLGAQDYLIKPDISPQLLSRSIKYSVERNKLKQQIEESENKYKDLVEVSRAAIYEVDFITNRFIYVNDFLCKQIGYTKKEFLSMTPKDILTEESYKKFIERIEKLNKGEYISNEFEYSAITKSGEIVWVIITATYREDKDGNIIGAKVIAIDITEVKKAKREAQRKEELIFNQLEERIQDWRKEISLKTVAHENKLREITLDINSMSIAEVQ